MNLVNADDLARVKQLLLEKQTNLQGTARPVTLDDFVGLSEEDIALLERQTGFTIWHEHRTYLTQFVCSGDVGHFLPLMYHDFVFYGRTSLLHGIDEFKRHRGWLEIAEGYFVHLGTGLPGVYSLLRLGVDKPEIEVVGEHGKGHFQT